jgi:hypothetical protein
VAFQNKLPNKKYKVYPFANFKCRGHMIKIKICTLMNLRSKRHNIKTREKMKIKHIKNNMCRRTKNTRRKNWRKKTKEIRYLYTTNYFSWLELTTKDEIGPLQWLFLHCNCFCQNVKTQNSHVRKQRRNMKHSRRHSIKLRRKCSNDAC